MGIREEKSLIHWNYFLALENDLAQVSRYIEFVQSNFKTHSIELSHLLLASSSEVDVIAKGICKLLDPKQKAENIGHYRNIITKKTTRIFKGNCLRAAIQSNTGAVVELEARRNSFMVG